jgi:hypothetical protein
MTAPLVRAILTAAAYSCLAPIFVVGLIGAMRVGGRVLRPVYVRLSWWKWRLLNDR